MFQRKRRVGIIGYGSLGKYLASQVLIHDELELAFVWNRNLEIVKESLDSAYVLESIDDFAERKPDLVVEVAHPDITVRYGAEILEVTDYMIGSPTALANPSLETSLKLAAAKYGLYIPCGALWGAEDIRKMADSGLLQKLIVTMTFHPDSLKLVGPLRSVNDSVNGKTTLYQGPVRELCKMAPNNVNTMAAAAIAAHNLGFDRTTCCLISDPSLIGWHVIEVDVHGRPYVDGSDACLHVQTVRRNPASSGQVTGSATYSAFFSSLMRALKMNRGPGMHLC